MPLSGRDPFDDNCAHLKTFPDNLLLDIARNESAQMDYRLFAVEILQVRKSEKLKHPDIQHLVKELEIELDGIVFEHPAPVEAPTLSASVTTKTLYGEPEPPPDDIPPTDPEIVPPQPSTKDKPDAT